MPDDGPQPGNPFTVTAPADPPATAATPPAPRRRWLGAVAGGLLLLLVAGLGRLRRPAEVAAPHSLRDEALRLADLAWQDFARTAKTAGVYPEMLWRTANDHDRLLVACKYGELELARSLLRAGADPNWVDHATPEHLPVEWEGATPLMLAARRGQLELVRLLLDAGARVDARDAEGETALHQAVRGGNEPLALLLLEHGADPNAASRTTNATPYGLAFGANLTELLQAMDQRGGHF